MEGDDPLDLPDDFGTGPLNEGLKRIMERESKLEALLREALEVLPGRGNLRRRIIQTLGDK